MENQITLEELAAEVRQLAAEVKALKGDAAPGEAHSEEPMENGVHQMGGMHPDDRLSSLMSELCRMTGKNDTGLVTYLGVYTSAGRQSNWIQHQIGTDSLLALIEDGSASNVLQCIGSSDRLNLLLKLLKQPMTVSAMVEQCGFNTTGQVYHHLKPLISADIVFEDGSAGRGVYAVKYDRIQGVIMVLAGISDLLLCSKSEL